MTITNSLTKHARKVYEKELRNILLGDSIKAKKYDKILKVINTSDINDLACYQVIKKIINICGKDLE